MNIKIIDKIFFLICFCLIFFNIPKFIQINFIGGILGSKLVVYPLIIGFIYTIYCQYKYKNIFFNFDKFKKYIILFWSIILLSTIVGLFIYPYYNLIINGPVNQIEKLPKVLSILNNMGIYIDEKFLIMLWLIIRIIKTVCLDIFYTFGGAYMIYCWYHERVMDGVSILIKAIVVSVIVIIIYGIIDMFYLLGNEMATDILIMINPFLHEVVTTHEWWPPLLWKGQLRSIFAEPSYYGIYSSFAMMFLWYKFIRVDKTKYKAIFIAIIFAFTFGLFLTKARTAIALFLGECIILILYMLYLRRKILLQKVMIIFIATAIAFWGANLVIANLAIWQGNDNINDINMKAYLEDNLTSLASTDKRSNTARYSIMIANFKIGIDHPLLGVGTNLTDAYIPEYLPAMSKSNHEVNMWLDNQKEKGILKSGFPSLGEYTKRFAQNGLVGIILFLIPPIILLLNLIKKIRVNYNNEDIVIKYVFFFISFVGIMASGIGDSINITYCYWVLLGLGYALCFDESLK